MSEAKKPVKAVAKAKPKQEKKPLVKTNVKKAGTVKNAVEKKPIKGVKATAKKEAVKKEVKKEKKKKDKAVSKLIEKIKEKKKPVFRGRFGKKQFRRKSKAKWAKWRKPQGIDIKRNREDGAIPSTGHRTRKEVRGMHPSGFREGLVHNFNELNSLNKGFAARIASRVGKKKRKEISKKAKEIGVKLLN